jgi:general secretion pathway protein K
VAAVSSQRGFALLIVLWTMVLLALLVAQFTTTGRTEVQVATNLRANAATEAAADGAIYQTIIDWCGAHGRRMDACA